MNNYKLKFIPLTSEGDDPEAGRAIMRGQEGCALSHPRAVLLLPRLLRGNI